MNRAALLATTILTLAGACTPVPPEAPAPPDTRSATTLARVQDDDGPGHFKSVEFLGDACSEESATVAFSPDNQVFTAIFSDFVAAAGENTPAEQANRGCLIRAQVEVPDGWSYALESVDYRGFVQQDDDVTSTKDSLYLISDSSPFKTPTLRFEDETSEDFTNSDIGPGRPSPFSPCGGGQELWIVTQTQVDNDGDDDNSGFLAMDSVDVELQWRRCR
jgi:hypothetical protein